MRLILGLSGVFLLVNPSGGAQVDSKGVGLILVGSFCFSMQMILIQHYLQPYNIWRVTAYQVMIPALITTTFWGIQGIQAGHFDFYVPGLLGWSTIIILGVFSTFIGRWLTYTAISIIGSGEMALISPIETTLAIIWSFLFLGEWLSVFQWVGVFLVIIGVVLGQLITYLPSMKHAVN
jgi:drug/metabolite transporter (DMT)-like permease